MRPLTNCFISLTHIKHSKTTAKTAESDLVSLVDGSVSRTVLFMKAHAWCLFKGNCMNLCCTNLLFQPSCIEQELLWILYPVHVLCTIFQIRVSFCRGVTGGTGRPGTIMLNISKKRASPVGKVISAFIMSGI